jgi:hypothetical protein
MVAAYIAKYATKPPTTSASPHTGSNQTLILLPCPYQRTSADC